MTGQCHIFLFLINFTFFLILSFQLLQQKRKFRITSRRLSLPDLVQEK